MEANSHDDIKNQRRTSLWLAELVLHAVRELSELTVMTTCSPDCPPETVARPAVDVDFLLDGQHQQHHVPVLAGQQEVVLEAEDVVGGHFLNLSVSRTGLDYRLQSWIARRTMSW